ncbi:GNAT family N-acetyltransferase [Deinococcus radiomollis]|uniref:GNAT family N-acetyltransferase n=1 Tax=Deinococcus radiomollis TaxID=468916 RepID=UPI0038920208
MLPDQIPRTLQTDRLLLRAPRQEDGPAVYRAVAESLPELRRWMVWAQQPLDEAGYTSNMAAAAEAFAARTELRFLIWDASGQELLGSTGFHALNWEIPKGEIGYWIHSAQAGKGYATEAVQALTQFGFETLGFRRIEIRCDALNEASAAVARRAGYAQDARLVNNAVAAGQVYELRDTLMFSRIR